jgi:hypothetical protein
MRRAAGALLLCLGLAGCGGDQAARDLEERPDPAPVATDPIAAAVDRTVRTGDARIEGRISVPIAGQRIRLEISGAVSFADDRLALHADYAENGVPAATAPAMRRLRWQTGFPRDQILDAGVAFIQSPRVRRLDAPRRWLFVDLTKVHEAGEIDLRRLAGMPEVNPAAMLEFLRTTGASRGEGGETIRGESLNRYRVRVDYADHPSKVLDEDRPAAELTVAQLAKWWGQAPLDVTVWTDAAGLIRRQRFSFTLPVVHEVYPATAEFEFLDFGNAPAIEIPDPEDTSNATPLAIEHAR